MNKHIAAIVRIGNYYYWSSRVKVPDDDDNTILSVAYDNLEDAEHFLAQRLILDRHEKWFQMDLSEILDLPEIEIREKLYDSGVLYSIGY